MVVNGELGQRYYQVGRPGFSPDGKLLAFTASQRKGAKFLVVGKTTSTSADSRGKKAGLDALYSGPEFDDISEVIFSPDGSRFAYYAGKNGKWSVVTAEKEFKDFDEALSLVFSPDGTKLAYIARQTGKEFIVIGDQKSPALDVVRDPILSEDGKTISYGARQGKQLWWKVMDVK